MEDGTRPEYIIPVGCAKHTWTMLKRLVSFRGEGWSSPWKGKQDSDAPMISRI